MQFRLMSLLLVMVAASVLFALMFAFPAFITLPVLTMVLWVSPSVWIAGVVYARGATQAFFLGGLVAGAVPFVIVASISGVMSVEFVSDFGDLSFGMRQYEERFQIIISSLVLLSTGPFSFVGGLLAVLVYRMNQRPVNRD
jgi:hypothetical protein